MVALAKMTWGLACYRAYGEYDMLPIAFLKPRDPYCFVGSANYCYYAICDRISRGEKP